MGKNIKLRASLAEKIMFTLPTCASIWYSYLLRWVIISAEYSLLTQ